MSKPAFDPHQAFEAADKPAFDPAMPFDPAPDMQTPKPLGPSKADSAMRGGAKGISFGLADELYGVVGGALNPANIHPEQGFFEGFPERYAASRDYARQKDAEAEEANPKTFLAGELTGSLASPATKALAAGKEVGALGLLGRGAAGGALAGAGESTAHPFQSPDELEHFGADVGGGAALGGALAGVGKLAGMGMSKLAPDSLKQIAEEQLVKAAGGEGGSIGRAGELLGRADEAGGPVVGWGSKAADIAKAARDKQAFFEKEVGPSGPTWRPFGGAEEKVIGGDYVTTKGIPGADIKAKAYQKIANSAQTAAEESSAKPAAGIGGMTFLASMMHGGHAVKSALIAAGAGLGKKAIQERGNAFAGRAAQGMAGALEGVPESIGTAAGAVNQYLQSGQGAQALTHEILDTPESAADIRRQRLREAMIRQLGNLREQGYGETPPSQELP